MENDTQIADPTPEEISFPEEFLGKLREEDAAGGPPEKKPEDDPDKSNDQTTTKSEKTTGKDGDETTSKEKPEEDPEKDKGTSDVKLDEATQSLLSEFKTEDGKQLVVADKEGKVHVIGDLIDDIVNSSNWKAELTAKSQEVAKDRDELTAKASDLSIDPIIEALSTELPEGIEAGSDKDTTLMNALDEWFEGAEKNPFRKISSIHKFTESQLAEGRKQAEESVKTAFSELAKVDEKYSNPNEQKSLLTYANQNLVSLDQAHKLQQVDGLTDEVKSLNTEVDKLKKELKTRTDQYTKLKEEGVTAEETTLKDENPSGPGKSGRDYAKKPKSFDEAAERGRRAFLGE